MLWLFAAKNIPGLFVLAGCALALCATALIKRRDKHYRYSLALHLASFLLWSTLITVTGDYLNRASADFSLPFISPPVVRFICASMIALMLLRKLFLLIAMLEKRQISHGSDITSARIISRILKICVVVAIILLYGEHFGMSFSGLLTFGGIGGIAVGMASKDILSNFFAGIMLYFDRPFNLGDWIRSPDRNIEGTVAEIGWRSTKIITFDNRPLYIPNSVFTAISVENPGRMTHRRIETVLTLRYEDSDKLAAIVDDIRQALQQDAGIDQSQTLLVNFNGFGDSSLNIMIYCFTHTTDWAQWLDIQQRVYLRCIDIVHQHGADFAFPSRTLYLDKGDAPLPENHKNTV
ncbi:mechanosensitive ion channel family protein [Shimwellia blattae]|uniref:Putative inner membrane protein n=1 Tax=Shimwellia blattae (strain ATCC 29907 / DSM 4481 / JCM 1650 / NBRC 105725 / CDC 9005-74) TaxID=630626 RepID=I2B9Z5_SHIBC|nr:mechanosensitive ion channel family protein [Shimwellia blattae]AFJ47349.1 putative inner membrane protein [Shimwellia blattae DSM 4481 = NBRC 105725]GAB80458.1 putative MscS family protein YnaI [Shimwellia blattae DSM 4481 = NBRC 105725]VDY64844.1 MscS family inner membrane protein YnaI [Shimwellia blattae]VEC22966.1 MscS family inner membrane protein YnaI [Shimwellia blattae]